MKKIIVISNTAFSIEKFRLHYLQDLYDYAIDIYTPFSKVKINSNVKNIKSKKLNNKNLLSELIFLNQMIKENIYSTFFIFSFKYQFLIGLIRLIKSFKVISLIAGKGYFFYRKNIINFLLKPLIGLIFRKFDKIICINPMDKKFFYNYLNAPIELIPTEGVIYKKIKNKVNRKKNFIYFSRIIKEKGINEFLCIAKHFKKKYKNLNFYICGPLADKYIGQSTLFTKKNYEKKIKQYKKYVIYKRFKKFENIFPEMDCLISPSYTEGAGTSVMEAMISGLFIIAYKNNGHKYILNGTNNILCNQNIRSLKDGIEKYINMDKKELHKISIKSKKKIYDNFRSKIVSKKIKTIFDRNSDKIK